MEKHYREKNTMTPLEDDPGLWSALLRFARHLAESLSFTKPFLGPAFIGAILAVSRKRKKGKGKLYWISAVCWSTAAGALLTPVFSHMAGIPDTVAGSTAAFVAIMGHEALGFLYGKLGSSWKGK